MNDRGIIICVGIAFLIFIFLWVYFKNKKVKQETMVTIVIMIN